MHDASLGRCALDLPGVEKTYDLGTFHAYSGSFNQDTIRKITDSPEVHSTARMINNTQESLLRSSVGISRRARRIANPIGINSPNKPAVGSKHHVQPESGPRVVSVRRDRRQGHACLRNRFRHPRQPRGIWAACTSWRLTRALARPLESCQTPRSLLLILPDWRFA